MRATAACGWFLEWRRRVLGDLQHRLRRRHGRLLIPGEDQAADFAGSKRGELESDQRAAPDTDQIHLAQPQLVDQVGDRAREVRDRHAPSRPVGCAAARQVRRVDGAIRSEERRAGIEIRPVPLSSCRNRSAVRSSKPPLGGKAVVRCIWP